MVSFRLRSSRQWTFLLGFVIGFVLIVVHLLTWHHSDKLLSAMIADKAGLFLDALAASAEQTLQASHYLEERVVSRLKAIAKEISATPVDLRTDKFLETLQRQHDLRMIEICDSSGKIIQSTDSKIVGSQLPHSFECQEILHGTKTEHAFGFSNGIFCETDAFGYACRLREGGLVRILTGVEFVLGFERNVGLPALLTELKKHPGVEALNVVDLSGKPILETASPSIAVKGSFVASYPLILHGKPIGRFELTISDPEISALRRTSAFAIAFSGVLSCTVLFLLLWRFQRYRDNQEHLEFIHESRRRIEGLGKVVAAVAHDVRNPLNTLSLGLRSLREDLTTQATNLAVFERLTLLEQTILHANHMVKDLLQSTRPISPIIREIDLTAWYQSLHLAFKTEYSDVKLEMKLDGRQLVQTDPDLLQRIIWNLSSNAFQAGAKNISILINSSSHFLLIEVADDGPGIPEDILRNLFVPGNTNRPEGSGMGLYNCHRISTALGGTLEVETRNNRTTFIINIPLGQRTTNL